MYAYCLTDFFNLALWPRHRPANYSDVRDGLEDLAAAAISSAEASGRNLTELTVRLYGGWHGERPETPVTTRDLVEEVVRTFPRRQGRTRIRLELADTPVWNKGVRLLRSVRAVALRSDPATFQVPILCPRSGACSLKELRSWWEGRCPDADCAVRLAEAGTSLRQKMVDTLLATDAVTIARDGLADMLVIASDDDDMIPILLVLRSTNIHTVRLKRDSSFDAYYDQLLEERGVQTRVW